MTPFSNIFERFLRKITDIKLAGMDVSVAEEIMIGWLDSVCAKFTQCRQNLAARNKTNKQFNITLTELEEEIMAKMMVAEWLEPNINNIMIMKQVLSSTDFKIYSQAQHLETLLKAKSEVQKDIEVLINRYSYGISDFSMLR